MFELNLKVHMLPAYRDSAVAPISIKDFGKGNGVEYFNCVMENTFPHHIYFTEDSFNIDIGDYVIKDKVLFLSDSKASNSEILFQKVVASTDTTISLLGIDDLFIDYFCKHKGAIDKVVALYDGNYASHDKCIIVEDIVSKIKYSYTFDELKQYCEQAWKSSREQVIFKKVGDFQEWFDSVFFKHNY